MRKKFSARAAALGMSGVLLTSALTGCTFGFASDPDDPNAVKEEVPIDMTTDTFQYDTSLSGTSIVIMNTSRNPDSTGRDCKSVRGESRRTY